MKMVREREKSGREGGIFKKNTNVEYVNITR